MEAKQRMEERIWAYMDGLLDGKEKAAVEKLLITDPAWKRCHDSLRDLDRTLHSVSLEEPSMRFTKNVMDQITSLQVAPATRTYVNKRIIYGICHSATGFQPDKPATISRETAFDGI